MARKRVGARRWNAQFYRHNGNQDDTGNPTYSVPADWDPISTGWPCEFIATTGGETVRGRQTTAEATYVLFGEFYGASGILASDRCEINGSRFGIVAVDDSDEMQMEHRIELRREQ